LIDLQCPVCGRTVQGVNDVSVKFNLSAHQSGGKCRAVVSTIDNGIEQRKRELAELTASVAGKEQRFVEVDVAFAQITKSFEARSAELAAVEQRLKTVNDSIEENDSVLDSQREDIGTNVSILEEQRKQLQKNVEVLSTQTPQLDALTALRSERKALDFAIADLTAKKSTLEKEVAELTEQIRKTAELRPELEKAARDEIIEQLVREEESRLSRQKGERLEIQRLYQTGEISLEEYIRRTRALTQ